MSISLTSTKSAASSSSSLLLDPAHASKADQHDLESGYGSASESASVDSSTAEVPKITLSKPHLQHLNYQLENLHPMEILRFAKIMFPNLYQTTAFGLTGLSTLDMLSKIQAESPFSKPVDLIFLDTLYHFNETHQLVDHVKRRYPNITIHTFKPFGVQTVAEFENMYGERLYEMSSELYDWIAKVEPLQRAFEDLNVAAVLTGRRRSQGGARDKIPIIELDDERGIIKINPMARWTFDQVQAYIRENNIPYNALLDQGYKSIGDWHSTSPVLEGEDERAGRWKGQQKTECGIHNKKSRYARFLDEMQRKDQEEKLAAVSAAFEVVTLEQTTSDVSGARQEPVIEETVPEESSEGLFSFGNAISEPETVVYDPVSDEEPSSFEQTVAGLPLLEKQPLVERFVAEQEPSMGIIPIEPPIIEPLIVEEPVVAQKPFED